MTRIAFLDVDGTILEHGSAIAPSTVTAIRQARANGHLVWLCTGRAEGDIHPDVKAIGFDGAISNGGAYATRDGEMVVEHPMRRDDVAAIEGYFAAHGIHYFLQTHEAVFASPGIEPLMDEYVRARRAERAAELAALGFAAPTTSPIPRTRPLAEIDRDQVAKAVFISPALDTVVHGAQELGERFHVIPGSIPLPGGSNGEIGSPGSPRARRSSRCSPCSVWTRWMPSASATAGTTSRCSRSSAPPSPWATPNPSCSASPAA